MHAIEPAGQWRARHRERGQIDVLVQIALVVVHRPNNVRHAVVAAATVEVVFEIAIELERLPRLDGDNPVDAPSIAKRLEPRILGVRNLVNEIPRDAIAHIEIGISAIRIYTVVSFGVEALGTYSHESLASSMECAQV